jgi:hypothetical protein
MIGEQIQINQDGTATVACKVPAQWIPLLKLIAASRDAVVNDLLKMCLHFIIETAKMNGLDPYRYLMYIFNNKAMLDNSETLQMLLPWNAPDSCRI